MNNNLGAGAVCVRKKLGQSIRLPESLSPSLVMPIPYAESESMGMFEGLKRLFGVGSDAASSATAEVASSGSALRHPRELKPWEDQTLSPHERFEAYKGFVQEKLGEIAASFDRAGEAKDVATQREIMNSPETTRWMKEGASLQGVSAEEFCERIDRTDVIELLGKNFLGAEAWQDQGIDVGEVPPFPDTITKSLLESDCPLHPGEKIKDTHLLVLIPKMVNGEPYTALKLDELCATRKGSGDKLIYDEKDWATSWKGQDWAKAPQAQSEWVLIPKSDPDPSKVPQERHFRTKDIAAQQKVHGDHYPEYREVKALEVMTAVLLYDLTHKERLLPDYLRCEEPNAFGGRVCVGSFIANGLEVNVAYAGFAYGRIGRALARKLKT